jgi:hypothetical protein
VFYEALQSRTLEEVRLGDVTTVKGCGSQMMLKVRWACRARLR